MQNLHRMHSDFTFLCYIVLGHSLVCSRSVHRVASYLQSRDIAHNLSLTRGCPFNIDTHLTPTNQTSTVRAYLWPRKSVFGEQLMCILWCSSSTSSSSSSSSQ